MRIYYTSIYNFNFQKYDFFFNWITRATQAIGREDGTVKFLGWVGWYTCMLCFGRTSNGTPLGFCHAWVGDGITCSPDTQTFRRKMPPAAEVSNERRLRRSRLLSPLDHSAPHNKFYLSTYTYIYVLFVPELYTDYTYPL